MRHVQVHLKALEIFVGVCINLYDMCNTTAPKVFLTKKGGGGQENETEKLSNKSKTQ